MTSSSQSTHCAHCGSQLPLESQFCPACGKTNSAGVGKQRAEPNTPSPPLHTLGAQPTYFPESSTSTACHWQTGDHFAGRYKIEKLLGRGGMGTVYLAQDEVSGRQVAIKIMNTDQYSESDVKRLIDEGILARDIRHPNVVAVYDADICDGQPYLTMEYLEGSSLRDLIRQKQASGETFTFVEAAQIMSQILEGLQAAHQAQIVHRDLKPENVMVTTDSNGQSRVKILDFGIAKNETQSRNSASTAGTLGYMSPEQFTSADLVGPTSDIYSLSVMFYELLVGALPQGHWQPPSQGRNDVPSCIDQLIEKGLSNRASNRPNSAREYQATIQQALENGTSPAWQNGVAEFGKSLGDQWKKGWGMGFKSEWWNSLTLQAKAWIIIGTLLVLGIIGSAIDDMNSDDLDYSDSPNAQQIQTQPDGFSSPSPW